MSPIKALRGRRGHRVLMLAWATIIVAGMLIGGYFLASAPGQIQDQRATATRVNCQEQNARHDATIAKLDMLIAQIPPGPKRDRALRSRAGTVALIESLAPKRDCEALVHRTVNEPPATN